MVDLPIMLSRSTVPRSNCLVREAQQWPTADNFVLALAACWLVVLMTFSGPAQLSYSRSMNLLCALKLKDSICSGSGGGLPVQPLVVHATRRSNDSNQMQNLCSKQSKSMRNCHCCPSSGAENPSADRYFRGQTDDIFIKTCPFSSFTQCITNRLKVAEKILLMYTVIGIIYLYSI